MAETINERLARLRNLMRRERLAAFIFPSTDPHGSEYVPARWEGRKWISGFDGSAGTAVVTMTSAALWTDSRYFIAAEQQLATTEYILMKERVDGTPTIAEWIGRQLASSDITEVGIDGLCSSAAATETLAIELRQQGGLTLRTNLDPLATLWTDRSGVPEGKVVVQPLKYAGETCRSKIARIRAELRRLRADGMLVSALDDIAWTLNLRGSDVECNPVFVAYLLISSQKVTLYINKTKLTKEVAEYLKNEGVATAEYGDITKGLRHYGDYNILIDPNETNYTMMHAAGGKNIVRAASPIPAMKAIKNEVEAEGFRQAMTRDGVAMVKFLKWLKPAVEQGGVTELETDTKLTELRAEDPMFRSLSFGTIAAYGEHGAIVHYEPTLESDVGLRAEGLFLLDSGAQYLDGTTDITRTIALGPTTEEQRRVYTLVLKGHLRLQNLKFPNGAAGTQIDAVAREAMWGEAMNFMHGTGHGVGAYLNVHEGPHQIRMEWRPAPLHAGMTVTDEPGLYLAGRFGVRIENTLLITEYKTTEFGRFLQFEPLTLCPIDKAPIENNMLTDEERQWLNNYHTVVYERLSPYLDDAHKQWLSEACAPL